MTTTMRARKPGKGIKQPTKGKGKAKVARIAKGKSAASKPAKAAAARKNATTPDEIRVVLAEAEAQLAACPFDDPDKLASLESRVSELRDKLDAAQLKAVGEPVEPHDTLAKIFASEAETVDLDKIDVLNETQQARMLGPEVERLARQVQAAGGLLHDVGVKIEGKRYVLIWGARRVAAHKLLDEVKISARVFPESTTPEQIAMLRTIENFGRHDLTPVGRALAVAEMLDSIAATLDGDSTAEAMRLGEAIGKAGGREAYVGQCLGRPEDWVRDYVFVSKLGGVARELLAERRLDLGHARELAKCGDRANADAIARRAARDVHGLGGKPVAWVREQVEADMRDLSKVPWRLDVAFAEDKEKGCNGWACASCPHNAVTQPLLFGLTVKGVELGKPDTLKPGETVNDSSWPTARAAADVISNAEQHDVDELGPVGICANGACFAVKQLAVPVILEKGLKSLAREIKGRGQMPLTRSNVESYTPPELRVEFFLREAKKAIDPDSGNRIADTDGTPTAAAKKGDGEGKSSKAAAASPEVEASREYRTKLDAWGKKSAKKICGAIDAKPGRLTYFLMMRSANQLASMNRNDTDARAHAKAQRVAESAPIKSLFKRWKAPELRDLIALEKQVNFEASSYAYDIERLVPDAALALADALGIDLDEPPAPPEPEGKKK